MHISYYKNINDTIVILQDKIKLVNINYKIVVSRNIILNNYLIWVNFKNILSYL